MTEPLADRRVHPATILLRVLREAPQTLFAVPAGIAFISNRGLRGALWVAGAIVLVGLVFHFLHWRRFRYGVGAREIVIESGILHRNRRSIPFDRIQDVDIEQALLSRLFGLAKVRIETGAGGKDEGVLDSVSTGEAARLRAAVRAWREGEGEWQGGRSETSAATDRQVGEARAAARPLFAMGPGRLLLYGLFNFSLVYIGGLFAALQTFDDPLKAWLGFDVYDPGRWLGLAGEAAHHALSAGAILALALIAIILGVVASLIRIVARDFGYLLSVEGGRFRRQRGLLTRSEAVIAKARVQLAYVETGPIRRWFGWFWLSFQTLGAGSDGSGHQVAAPFARSDEIVPILAETGALRLPPNDSLTMVSRRHIVRAIIRNVLLPTAAIAIASIWWPPALYLAALLPPLALVAALERRCHRYGLDGELLFVRRGVWRQQLFVVPVASLQALSLARSWLQRRLGLATLIIDTAGAPVTRAPRITDLRADVAASLAAEIAARHRAQRATGQGSRRR